MRDTFLVNVTPRRVFNDAGGSLPYLGACSSAVGEARSDRSPLGRPWELHVVEVCCDMMVCCLDVTRMRDLLCSKAKLKRGGREHGK